MSYPPPGSQPGARRAESSVEVEVCRERERGCCLLLLLAVAHTKLLARRIAPLPAACPDPQPFRSKKRHLTNMSVWHKPRRAPGLWRSPAPNGRSSTGQQRSPTW